MKIYLADSLAERRLISKVSIKNKELNKLINACLMKVFLAGGVSGNLNKVWKEISQKESSISFEKQVAEQMKVFLAGENNKKNILRDNFLIDNARLKEVNILESFFYIRKNEEFMPIIKQLGSFLLDSGAFTFMSGNGGKCDWDNYVEEYAKFINKHDVKLFFELDIDSLVGLKEVERLRAKLEDLTGKRPIPVWHKSRGKEYFIKMCENYPYVALGGIVTKEIPRKIYEQAFPWFIEQAHKRGVKIHGLGYTTISNLKKYHFDSVDSTAWLYGNRGGYIYKFNPNTGLMEQLTKEGCRLKTNEGAVNNFNEWVKLSIYAERNW